MGSIPELGRSSGGGNPLEQQILPSRKCKKYTTSLVYQEPAQTFRRLASSSLLMTLHISQI